MISVLGRIRLSADRRALATFVVSATPTPAQRKSIMGGYLASKLGRPIYGIDRGNVRLWPIYPQMPT
jgi:hypothetical protein